ncbi:MAG: hypothetical protein ACP5OG_03940 [Candidatus Nanoarchaeia archaeon]
MANEKLERTTENKAPLVLFPLEVPDEIKVHPRWATHFYRGNSNKLDIKSGPRDNTYFFTRDSIDIQNLVRDSYGNNAYQVKLTPKTNPVMAVGTNGYCLFYEEMFPKIEEIKESEWGRKYVVDWTEIDKATKERLAEQFEESLRGDKTIQMLSSTKFFMGLSKLEKSLLEEEFPEKVKKVKKTHSWNEQGCPGFGF